MAAFVKTSQIIGLEIPSFYDGEEKIDELFSIRWVKGVLAEEKPFVLCLDGKFLWYGYSKEAVREDYKQIIEKMKKEDLSFNLLKIGFMQEALFESFKEITKNIEV
jgi:hypothetical protein